MVKANLAQNDPLEVPQRDRTEVSVRFVQKTLLWTNQGEKLRAIHRSADYFHLLGQTMCGRAQGFWTGRFQLFSDDGGWHEALVFQICLSSQ